MGINELCGVIMSEITWCNMLLMIIIVILGVTIYGLLNKLRRVENDLDDIYYLMVDVHNKLSE